MGAVIVSLGNLLDDTVRRRRHGHLLLLFD
jgi:hypothetical protein